MCGGRTAGSDGSKPNNCCFGRKNRDTNYANEERPTESAPCRHGLDGMLIATVHTDAEYSRAAMNAHSSLLRTALGRTVVNSHVSGERVG
jgi:hypothetical protein